MGFILPPIRGRSFPHKGILLGGGSSVTKDRKGPGGNAGKNALSSVFGFTDTLSAGNDKTYLITSDGDFVSMNISVQVTPTGNTQSGSDVLTAISQLIIQGPEGPIMTLKPSVDFYDLVQRFGELHQRPSVVALSGATAETFTAEIPGISLPLSRGPYTVELVMAAASAVGVSTTAVSTVVTIQWTKGVANKRSRFQASNLPFTPAASGINDLSPLSPIQGMDLVEMFFTGLTSNTLDINYVQMESVGATVSPRVTSAALVNLANTQMVTALVSTELFLLLALQTTIKLGRESHMYLNWGSSPSSSIRIGFYWLD